MVYTPFPKRFLDRLRKGGLWESKKEFMKTLANFVSAMGSKEEAMKEIARRNMTEKKFNDWLEWKEQKAMSLNSHSRKSPSRKIFWQKKLPRIRTTRI